MDHELVSADQFEELPEDDEQCFVELEAICGRKMVHMLEEDRRSDDYYAEVRAQYMAAIYSAARQCGVPNIPNPHVSDQFKIYEFYSTFTLAVRDEVTRIRLQNRQMRGRFSVQLTQNTRTKIRHYIDRLRDAIRRSDLPDAKRATLQTRLNDLEDELRQRRLGFGKAMVILSAVMVGLASATTVAAEGPAAITHIMRLIGLDKESEEAALSRLAPSPKALPALPQKPVAPTKPVPSATAATKPGWEDNEIPF